MPRLSLKTKPTCFQTLVLLWVAAWCGACDSEQSPSKGLVILNEVGCHGRDWLEIVNVSDTEQDISGWYVADDKYESLHQYEIPDDTVMQVDEYIVIQRQQDAEAGFSFGVKCEQDTVYLLDSDQAVVDQVDVGLSQYGNSWGRLPNITGIWRETYATPGKINQPPLTGLQE